MSKLTAKEILDRIEASGFTVDSFAHDESDYTDELYVNEDYITDWEEIQKRWEELKESLGGWKEVQQHGGEGQGEDWYSVKYFPAHNVFIKTEGWYTSYHGTDFEDGYGFEVWPAEKVITVYNPVEKHAK